jgi:CheY-like chemotaxis protein
MTRKILAIDDSLTFRKFIGKALAQTPGRYAVALAKDGEDGIAQAEADCPELILLDYVLPDLSGDEVCARLAALPGLAGVPIILMSSSVEAIEETASRYPSVRGTVAKPFTPELLCDTVEQVFTEEAGGALAPVAITVVPEVEDFSGNTGSVSLINALLSVQRAKLTGVLTLTGAGRTVQLGCRGGQPVGMIQGDLWQKQAAGLADFAHMWTAMDVRFRFQSATALPIGAAPIPPIESMVEWAMDSLRWVKDEAESSYAWGDSTGVPAFNRVGYERVQRIALTQEEIDFVKQVDARSSVVSIAERLRWPVPAVHQVLFRFLCLEVFDFWPASILAANRG